MFVRKVCQPWRIAGSLQLSGLAFFGAMNMKVKLFAVAAWLGVTLVSASATTYNYVGETYTSNVDPTIYGTHMTGSVTFNQDTSNFTGTIYISSGDVTALTLTSGTITATLPYFDIFAGLSPDYFRLVNGSIQAWLLHGASPSFALVTPSYSLYSQGDSSICNGCGFGFDNIESWFPSGTFYASKNQNTASWSVAKTPLPAALPLFASGLGALGLLGWRRKRKAAAITAQVGGSK